jgi:hypothetical protein
MSEEVTRRIRSACRKAVIVLNDYAESDIHWTEVQAIALMLTGLPFADAVKLATKDCAQRICTRQLLASQGLQAEQERLHKESSQRRLDDLAKLDRNQLGQKPSLKTSLGSMLVARKVK